MVRTNQSETKLSNYIYWGCTTTAKNIQRHHSIFLQYKILQDKISVESSMFLCQPGLLSALSLLGGERGDCGAVALAEPNVPVQLQGPSDMAWAASEESLFPEKYNWEAEREDNDIAYLHITVTLRTEVQHISVQQLSKGPSTVEPQKIRITILKQISFWFCCLFCTW